MSQCSVDAARGPAATSTRHGVSIALTAESLIDPAIKLRPIGGVDGNQSTFNIPQLSKFIGRTRSLRSPHQTSIELSEVEIVVTHDFRLSSPSPSSGNSNYKQVSASLASPERLDVVASSDLFVWRNPGGEADAVQCLEFLRLFPGVKRLEISSTLASIVASAFEQVTRTSDVLPSLCELHMGGSQASTSSSIEGFAAVRERSGHPVSVHYQSGEFDS
ncbi:hypothetical protein EDB83DRAFT_2527706 [Lactarius deliciosus]|nr:hypothetical protein EDB83DRAFT_2527706 [Lactarius deliciosus]